MPWTPADVEHKTKKATTPKAKRQWTHIANSALQRGEDDKHAIMMANGVIAREKSRRNYHKKTT